MEPEEIEAIVEVVNRVAKAIKDGSGVGTDAAGGAVGSLTEAVMGTTAGLVQIANAIERLAEAAGEVAESIRGSK